MNIIHSFKSSQIYHIFNKSIANFGIFRGEDNKNRFLQALDYYNEKRSISLSVFLRNNLHFVPQLLRLNSESWFKFISYCVMPDHYHLLIKIINDNIFSKYINDVENSYSRYFNCKFNRKGPLWQSNFKYVRIKSNEQLLHVSRYIHLNPTTANLVAKPEDWQYSSYANFICNPSILKEHSTEISISDPSTYKKFIEDQVDYQRKLKTIKKLILE